MTFSRFSIEGLNVRRLTLFVFAVLLTAMPALSQLAARTPGPKTPGSSSCLRADSAGVASDAGSSCGLAPGITLGTFATGRQPLGVAIDSGGNVLVANHTSETVEKFSPTGSVLWTTPVKGTEMIAIDADDYVWTGNYQSGVLTELSPSGSVVGAYTLASGSPNPGPEGIAVAADGNIWVTMGTSPANVGLVEVSPEGRILQTISFPSNSHVPGTPAIDVQGNVWVPYGSNLLEYSAAGAILNTYSTGGAAYCSQVVIDHAGDPWMVCGTQQVLKFSPATGAILENVSVDASGPGLGPAAAAVDGDNNLWVAGKRGATVAEVSPSGQIMGIYADGGRSTAIAVDAQGDVWIPGALANNVTQMSTGGAGMQTPMVANLGALKNDCANMTVTLANAPPSLVNGVLSYCPGKAGNSATDLDTLYPTYPAVYEGKTERMAMHHCARLCHRDCPGRLSLSMRLTRRI